MDYKSSFLTDATPAVAFHAITKEVHNWWGKVDNPVEQVGDEFSIFFGDTEWRFEITTYNEDEQLTWQCIKANHLHEGLDDIKTEWLNTSVVWKITPVADQTEITITHNGLNQNLNCYEVCKAGWDYYLLTSLRQYLDNGSGTPYL